jgi:hypothetical protein
VLDKIVAHYDCMIASKKSHVIKFQISLNKGCRMCKTFGQVTLRKNF